MYKVYTYIYIYIEFRNNIVSEAKPLNYVVISQINLFAMLSNDKWVYNPIDLL